MPTLAVEELLSVFHGEPGELEVRLAELLRRHGLDASRAPELAERSGALAASAGERSPPPSAEALALALLALIALEARA